MDINFHYFTIKVLATYAGFNEDEAQIIAQYSQFVDDFHPFHKIDVTNVDVPDFAKFRCQWEYIDDPSMYIYFFDPVNTGFAGIDYVNLIKKQNQENITIPFHFISKKQLNRIDGTDRRNYRVVPANNQQSCLIKDLLNMASKAYRQKRDVESLIRIGILMHILGDTYSHQKFSGYWGWENHAKLIKVINNITGKEVTSEYWAKIDNLFPAIGHANISTVPDETHLSFGAKFKKNESDNNYSDTYERNNTIEFLEAARIILNNLRKCKNLQEVTSEIWEPLSKKIEKGFLTSEKDESKLEKHWASIFNDIRFEYKKDSLNNISYNYFLFNIVAFYIREIVKGTINIKLAIPYIYNLILK